MLDGLPAMVCSDPSCVYCGKAALETFSGFRLIIENPIPADPLFADFRSNEQIYTQSWKVVRIDFPENEITIRPSMEEVARIVGSLAKAMLQNPSGIPTPEARYPFPPVAPLPKTSDQSRPMIPGPRPSDRFCIPDAPAANLPDSFPEPFEDPPIPEIRIFDYPARILPWPWDLED